MNSFSLIAENLLSPIVLSFFLGVVASRIKSDLKIPEALYVGISIYLLFAIGLKGGAALSETPLSEAIGPMLFTLALSLITPAIAFIGAKSIGRLSTVDAAAMAAHYGSVSAVTFMAALSFLRAKALLPEAYLPALVALLEIPAIMLAIAIGNGRLRPNPSAWISALSEAFSLKSVLLLFGGLVIGWIGGRAALDRVAPFFVAPFEGVLALFLIELGVLAGQSLHEVRYRTGFLLGFGVLVPLVNGTLGVVGGWFAGMSASGATVLGALAAGASYIAAPAAVKVSLPEANLPLATTAALAITFPFNICFGIPFYYMLAGWLFAS